MSISHKIPLIAAPQKLTISLAGVVYTLTIRWCRPAGAWMLDIADVNEAPILNGIPLVTGADLLAQYAYLAFGGQLIAQTDNAALLPPTFGNLGTTGNLYFVTS